MHRDKHNMLDITHLTRRPTLQEILNRIEVLKNSLKINPPSNVITDVLQAELRALRWVATPTDDHRGNDPFDFRDFTEESLEHFAP